MAEQDNKSEAQLAAEQQKADEQNQQQAQPSEPQQETGVREGEEENPLFADGAETPGAAEQAANQGYVENENHIPDPTAMSGTLETSGTGGGTNETLRGTTGVFEHAGLASYRSDDVVTGDATGQPSPHDGSDAHLASSSDAVDGGITRVEESGPTSYTEQNIAGSQDPNLRQQGEAEGPNTTAVKADEKAEDDSEDKKSDEESKDGDKADEGPQKSTTTARKTAAKKTTAGRKTASEKTD